MPRPTKKSSVFASSAGYHLGSGAVVNAIVDTPTSQAHSAYKPDTNVNDLESDEEDDSANKANVDDTEIKDLLKMGDGVVEQEEDGKKEDEEEHEQDDAGVPGTMRTFKDEEKRASRREAKEVGPYHTPKPGDSERRNKDGSIEIVKGGGIKDEGQILAGARKDPNFNNILAKAKTSQLAIIKRAEQSTRGKPKEHDFSDRVNKTYKSSEKSNDRVEECLIGPYTTKACTTLVTEKSTDLDDDDFEQAVRLGYHPHCMCSVCIARRTNDNMAKARAETKRREDLKRKQATDEAKAKRDKNTERSFRKVPKKLRSSKIADEGCMVKDDWIDG
ncbi:unnamed protein product [Alternaria alternata]